MRRTEALEGARTINRTIADDRQKPRADCFAIKSALRDPLASALLHRHRGHNRSLGAGGGNRTLTGLPPTDFRTIYGFRRLALRVCALARLWSGLSLHRSVRRVLSFALGAARLVSTPSRVRGLGSGLPCERFSRI